MTCSFAYQGIPTNVALEYLQRALIWKLRTDRRLIVCRDFSFLCWISLWSNSCREGHIFLCVTRPLWKCQTHKFLSSVCTDLKPGTNTWQTYRILDPVWQFWVMSALVSALIEYIHGTFEYWKTRHEECGRESAWDTHVGDMSLPTILQKLYSSRKLSTPIAPPAASDEIARQTPNITVFVPIRAKASLPWSKRPFQETARLSLSRSRSLSLALSLLSLLQVSVEFVFVCVSVFVSVSGSNTHSLSLTHTNFETERTRMHVPCQVQCGISTYIYIHLVVVAHAWIRACCGRARCWSSIRQASPRHHWSGTLCVRTVPPSSSQQLNSPPKTFSQKADRRHTGNRRLVQADKKHVRIDPAQMETRASS